MAGVNVTIDGNLFGAIEEIQEKMKDLRVPLIAFGLYLERVTSEERFDKETSPDGIKWTKKNTSYQRWKAANHPTRGINVLHANMRDSIVAQMQGKKKLLFGTVIEYAENRQKENPFIGVNEDDIQELRETIQDYLVL